MSRLATALLLCATGVFAPARLHAQTSGQSIPPTAANPAPPTHVFIPMAVPKLSPGVLQLLKLEGEFSAAVTTGGGRAFSSWFADDGVTLNNGKPAVLGRTAIAATANWDPAQYQLSWYAEGAQMGPSNDTGFTWGHYDATSIAKDGKSTTLTGRYITIWKKVNGEWKVALDASANEPPPSGGLPTP
jgi:ketosteroid isomerase-like protein